MHEPTAINLILRIGKPKLAVVPAPYLNILALINKVFEVVIDSRTVALHEIHESGRQRGLNIHLPVVALAELTGAK